MGGSGRERPTLGQGLCGEEGLTSSQASCLPPSATWPTSCLQKGVSPTPRSFLRGLSQGCIFGITQPFCSWLLASILQLSGVGQAVSPSMPGVQRRGGHRRETAGLPWSPSPPTGTRPLPARAHSWGRQVFPGCLPWDGGHLPPLPPPRWPGQPRRVFLDRVEGVGWRGQAGREGQWAWLCHGRGIWRMWPFCGGCGVGGQGA